MDSTWEFIIQITALVAFLAFGSLRAVLMFLIGVSAAVVTGISIFEYGDAIEDVSLLEAICLLVIANLTLSTYRGLRKSEKNIFVGLLNPYRVYGCYVSICAVILMVVALINEKFGLFEFKLVELLYNNNFSSVLLLMLVVAFYRGGIFEIEDVSESAEKEPA